MNVVDTIRREQFCQIRDEICSSNDYLVVGIDVAKHKHHAFMGSATGKSLLRRLVFDNDLQVIFRGRPFLLHFRQQSVKGKGVP